MAELIIILFQVLVKTWGRQFETSRSRPQEKEEIEVTHRKDIPERKRKAKSNYV